MRQITEFVCTGVTRQMPHVEKALISFPELIRLPWFVVRYVKPSLWVSILLLVDCRLSFRYCHEVVSLSSAYEIGQSFRIFCISSIFELIIVLFGQPIV